MSSPNKYRNTSPVRTLEDRFYSRPLQVILEQNNANRLSNSLIYQNQVLEKENEILVHAVARSKDGETQQMTDNMRLKKEKEQWENNFKKLESAASIQKEAKERQIESQERDIRLLREEYGRENQALKEQNNILVNRIGLIEADKHKELENIKKKCLSATAEEKNFLKKNLSEELRKVVGQLQLTKHILLQKQKENQHLIILSEQRAGEYTLNLQTMISENNVLRNQLDTVQHNKNKEIQLAQNKKELEKSRTIGILSYCKENNQFMDKELGKLAEQLLEKNISIESFTKEILKLRRNVDVNQRRYEELMANQKIDCEDLLREKDKEIARIQKYHKEDLMQLKMSQADLEERLASSLNDLDNFQRELAHVKDQSRMKDREIEELKENVGRMHEDHSKELSKVMLDSRVKRRSGMNISSYSSSSLKDIDDAQGSSIIRVTSMQRKNSSNDMMGPGGLPVVKQELAVSQGHLDEEQDIEIKELILHYESMIEELKKNKANELSLASQKIDTLKYNLDQKQQELIEALNRYEPLLDLQINRGSIEEERRIKIEESQKSNISILEVLLQKYGIVSLRPKNS